ncbi:DNA double-strand break repair Rad50 ATPase [hydrothermal vent metagenome]|uniref:DNA double-strand break repair Rad50 ATPase n=1 Tax=hydrothermal vent metagenome TaxID=652676 RepID=A0A1W1EHQ7_9ZZZZ
MSAGEVTTIGVQATTGSTIGVGALTGVGIIGIVAVGVWVYNKRKDEEAFEYNQKILKDEFDFMLGEVKKLQDSIFEKFNVKVDFLKELSKEAEFGLKMYDKSLIKDKDHNKKYQKIVEDFAKSAKETIYKLKELESERLEELDKKIEKITNEFNSIEKNELLINQIEEMSAIKEELKGEFASWEDKYSMVSRYQRELDKYQKSIKAIYLKKGIEEIIDGVEEQDIEIISPIEKLIIGINEFKEKIQKYDTQYNKFNDISSFSRDKLKMVFESIKLDYGKAKEIFIWSNIYREDLEKLSHLELNDEVQNRITLLKNQDKISKDEFKSIADEINQIIIAKQEREILIETLRDNLNSMGYSVVNEEENITKLENGEIVYLDTDEDDYKIMLKLNKNSMITRVVRVVATQEEKDNVNSYQREKDIQAGKKWCSSYDKLTNLLTVNGIEIDTTLRIEPQDDDLTYIVDDSLVVKSKKKSAKEDRVRYFDE